METKVSQEDCYCWGNYEFGNGSCFRRRHGSRQLITY